METEKLKLWLDFGKFFLGTFLIGFISLVVKWGFQDREIAIKESEQIGKYVEIALKEDIGVRKRFAEYFKTVLVSSDYRERWSDYYDLVYSEYEIKLILKDSLQKKYDSIFASLGNLEMEMDSSIIEVDKRPQYQQLKQIKMDVARIDNELTVERKPSQKEF